MKMIILVSVLLVLFALLFPAWVVPSPVSADTPSDADEPSVAADDGGTDDTLASDDTPFYSASADAGTLEFKDGDSTYSISMSDYLFGAVAAEMPATFEMAALEAQAVALRSYVWYKIMVAPSDDHGAAVCSDSTCCAAWSDETALREEWGDDYDAYAEKIRAAVGNTDGLILAYDGAPALAVFHSSSAGYTESSGEVWSGTLPYLVSVPSPESAEDVPDYVFSVTVSADDFRETILERYPDAMLSGDASDWIGDITYSGSGRVHSVQIGGAVVSGTMLRSLFELRSTCVAFSVSADSVTMTCTGHGHGVGMSQYGANVCAAEGLTFSEILERYYPGTAVVSVDSAAIQPRG